MDNGRGDVEKASLLLAALGLSRVGGDLEGQSSTLEAPASASQQQQLSVPHPPTLPPNWSDEEEGVSDNGSGSPPKPEGGSSHSSLPDGADVSSKHRGKVSQLFSKMKEGQRRKLKLDETALFSVTGQDVADQLTKLIHELPGVTADTLILDGTACVGGNLLSFASSGKYNRVWGAEIDPVRFNMLQNNVRVALSEGARRRVRLFQGDIVSLLREWAKDGSIRGSILFLDPPWGGPKYKEHVNVDLLLSNVPVQELCEMAGTQCGCLYVIIKAPFNYPVADLTQRASGKVKVIRELRKMLLLTVAYDSQRR